MKIFKMFTFTGLSAGFLASLGALSLMGCEKKGLEPTIENNWPEMYVVRVNSQGQAEYAALSQHSGQGQAQTLAPDDFESLIARSAELHFQPAHPESVIDQNYPSPNTATESLYFVRQVENYSQRGSEVRPEERPGSYLYSSSSNHELGLQSSQSRVGHGPPPRRGHRGHYRRDSCSGSRYSSYCGSRQRPYTHYYPSYWNPQFHSYMYQPVWYWQWNYYYYTPVYSTQNYLYWYFFYRW